MTKTEDIQFPLFRRRPCSPSREAKPAIELVWVTNTVLREVIAEVEGEESGSASWAIDFVLHFL